MLFLYSTKKQNFEMSDNLGIHIFPLLLKISYIFFMNKNFTGNLKILGSGLGCCKTHDKICNDRSTDFSRLIFQVLKVTSEISV